MIEISNNPWITGVGGGIISGFIVYYVTNIILHRKQNKEYSQKITTANNELLYAMRPLIVQKQIPEKSIINSVIEATARKHQVNKIDLFDIHLLADDLIHEIIENAFLDSDQKVYFCNKVNELKTEETSQPITTSKIIYQKDRLSSQYVSILLAITSSLMFFLGSVKMGFDWNGFKNIPELISIVIIVTGFFLPMMAIVITTILKRIKQHNQEEKDQHDHEKEID